VKLKAFLVELKRRHVYRVAVAYCVVAWLFIQIATQVFPFFDVPNWAVRLVVLAIIIGFPAALGIAWVFELTPRGLKRAADLAPDEHTRRWSSQVFAILIIAVALLATGLFIFQRTRSKTVSLPATTVVAPATMLGKSIAVLPLRNESGDPADDYFSDGLTEEIIAALAQIKGLKVIGRSSSFQFKNRTDDNKKVGRKLGVSNLLDGTVRKQGDRVRIVAELVNTDDGSQVWSRTFDGELKDIFALQAEIAQAAARSLELTLLASDDKSTNKGFTESVDAHNAYLQGHFYFQRRNPEDYRKAVKFFDEAIRLDPDYALAYAERSEAWTWIGDLSSEEQKEAWATAATDAEKAVGIDPDLAEAHAALGWVRFFVQWKFTEGLAELRRAKDLSPWNATASDLLARVVVYIGRFEEAEKMARQAIELDPLAYQARISLARTLYAQGKLDEAEDVGRKAAELQPTAAGSRRWQVIVAVERGAAETALHEAQMEPNEGYQHFELALAYYAQGNRSASDGALAEMIERDKEYLAYQIAEVYAWRGEPDKAFEWLEISFHNHDSGTLSIVIDRLLRNLHQDERYKALVARLGLPMQIRAK
jgi:serine/threonine-protein kinase